MRATNQASADHVPLSCRRTITHVPDYLVAVAGIQHVAVVGQCKRHRPANMARVGDARHDPARAHVPQLRRRSIANTRGRAPPVSTPIVKHWLMRAGHACTRREKSIGHETFAYHERVRRCRPNVHAICMDAQGRQGRRRTTIRWPDCPRSARPVHRLQSQCHGRRRRGDRPLRPHPSAAPMERPLTHATCASVRIRGRRHRTARPFRRSRQTTRPQRVRATPSGPACPWARIRTAHRVRPPPPFRVPSASATTVIARP